MTGRDRIVVIGIAVVVMLGAAWLILVSPERKKAAAVNAQVSTATSQLATAEGQVANARSAQTQYSTAYASIVRLGKAVPPTQEVPSLVYQLAHATNQRNVEFASITASTGGGSSTSAASTPAPTASAATAGAGFSAMPFTFVFNGGFFNLYDLFQQLNHFTLRTSAGSLQVSGRLLTIQSVQLAPGASSSSGKSNGQLTGTISATAYVLPASQAASAATATSPTGAQTTSGSATSSPATPAVIGATR